MRYLGTEIDKKDKFLFIILFRTIKEFGFYSYKLKNLGHNKSEIIAKCLNSRRTFCNDAANLSINESIYYNTSIWPSDIGIHIGCPKNETIRLVYICRVINSKNLDSKLVKEDLINWVCKNSHFCCREKSKYNGCVLSALKKLKRIKRPKKDSDMYKRITHEIDKFKKLKNIKEDTFIMS